MERLDTHARSFDEDVPTPDRTDTACPECDGGVTTSDLDTVCVDCGAQESDIDGRVVVECVAGEVLVSAVERYLRENHPGAE